MNDITFYQRFEADILAGRKTITIRDKSESHFKAGDILRVGRFEDNQYFCMIEVLSVSPITLDELTDQHAKQENMGLDELKEVIRGIYPSEERFYVIKFKNMKNTNSSKEPIKHHYIPRAFLKAWADENDRVHWTNIDKNIENDNDIYTIFYKKNLYKLATSLETDFVTPFIDKKLFPYFKKLLDNSWSNLDFNTKTNIIRYFLSLSVRNPISIEKMRDAPIPENYQRMLKNGLDKYLSIGEDVKKEIIDGFYNGNLFFMGILLDELELEYRDFENIYNQVHKDVFSIFRTLIDAAKFWGTYTRSYSSYILEKLDSFCVREFVTESNKLITSNNPIKLHDINPTGIGNKFFLLANISPRKAILFTNSKEIKALYDLIQGNENELVNFFNTMTAKGCEQLVSKINNA